MGCDIHMFPEVDGRPKSDWVYDLGEFEIDRHYKLFSQLARVRASAGDAGGFKPKGLPDKMGFTANMLRRDMDGDAHSDSWLTYKELRDAETSIYNYRKDDWYLMLEAVAKKRGVTKARVVFWFDN